MRSRSDVERQFSAGWPDLPSSWDISQVRDGFDSLAVTLWSYLPDGPEKTITLRKLQDAQLMARVTCELAEDDVKG